MLSIAIRLPKISHLKGNKKGLFLALLIVGGGLPLLFL
jgi:hypothetical protein